MPVSDLTNIVPIMNKVRELQPRTVVDLGCGFGKYGALCREVLDAQYGRTHISSWQSHIVGVEGFKDYENPLWDVYNIVYNQDIRDFVQVGRYFDLALLVDCLEHFERTDAMNVLLDVAENCNHIIYSVPIGDCPQGPVFNNPLEVHRASWSGVPDIDLYKLPKEIRESAKILRQGVCSVVYLKGLANANV